MEINYTEEDLVDHHAVSAIIKDENGNILMQDHVKFGFWTIPIGKANPRQDPIDGIKEEVLEECNLIIEELEEIANQEKSYERNGRIVKDFIHTYKILKYSGELKNNEPHKHTEQKFMSLDKIKKLPYLSDQTIIFLERVGFKRGAKLTKNNKN